MGNNTPVIIKYTFWKITYKNPKAVYACINQDSAVAPLEIEKCFICLGEDIEQVIDTLKRYL